MITNLDYIKTIKNYTVIDIETTGLDLINDEIIEVSAIKVVNNCIKDKYSKIIRVNKELDQFIIDLTGLDNKKTQSGEKFENVLKEFLIFINGDILVGYNIKFDIDFLNINLKLINSILENEYIDVLWLTKKLIKDIKNYKLETVTQYFNIESSKHHRALNDASYTQEIFEKLKNK